MVATRGHLLGLHGVRPNYQDEKKVKKQQPVEKAMSRYKTRQFPNGVKPKFLEPEETWSHKSGRAGLLIIYDRCHIQTNFFLESMR
jgi:hypothetical protein